MSIFRIPEVLGAYLRRGCTFLPALSPAEPCTENLGLSMERHCVMLEQYVAEFACFCAELDAEFVI
jgi:hypothetical protein